MSRQYPIKELIWCVPFICVGLIALALTRPPPVFPAPAQSRIVTDAEGIKVPIEIPFRGTFYGGVGGYLEATRAPETLLKVGDSGDREWFAKEAMSWIYPNVLNKDSLWDVKFTGHGPYKELETLLAYEAGVYIEDRNLTPMLRRLGLPALSLSWHEKNWDEVCFSAARIETALTNEPEQGETVIAHYRQAFANLAHELQPETLTTKPRILIMGSDLENRRYLYVKNEKNDYQIYLPPAGVTNAANASVSQGPDAERILAMDPDFIFLMGGEETPEEYMRDLRWLGLKAVQTKRIYQIPGVPDGGGGLAGLIFQPLWVRWMAEIVHPDRLRPALRQVLRDTLLREFHYGLSEAQIDLFLRIDQNENSVGYARFTRHDQASNGQELTP
jgi:ABC-type Fe3+-hydroxamate transport system substrate-binding protein